MAENKQYLARNQENGQVLISEDVIAAIVLHSMSETDGFAGVSTKPGADIAELIGKNWGKGIKVIISEANELTVDANIQVYYGYSVMTVAKDVQNNVITALESVTGAKVLGVNVNVCGIIRK